MVPVSLLPLTYMKFIFSGGRRMDGAGEESENYQNSSLIEHHQVQNVSWVELNTFKKLGRKS